MKKMVKRKKIKDLRVARAAKSLAKIEKAIAPYLSPRTTRVVSTAGKWREESNATTTF